MVDKIVEESTETTTDMTVMVEVGKRSKER